MSFPAAPEPASTVLGNLGVAALVVAVGAVTVVGGFVSGGNPFVTLAPMMGVALWYALVNAPLRWPATALVFLVLALEVHGDASNIYATPLVHLGNLLTDTAGLETHVNVAGAELLVLVLIGVWLARAASGSRIDGTGHVQAPSVVRFMLLLLLVGFLYAEALSILGGHGISPWKARYVLHMPLLYVFFQVALPRPTSFRPIGWAIVAAAHVKALLAAWVQLVEAPLLTGGQLAFATNHGDSILFVMALLIVLLPAFEGGGRRAVIRALLLVPIPFWGVMLNHRRIAYAMLELSLVIVFVLGAWRPWKKRLVTALVLGAPLVALYLWFGWNSTGEGSIYAPVRKVRSLVDSKVDPSTYWREVESWNIARNLRDRPLVGIGLGGEYKEYMVNDDISAGYPDYRGWPHNTVLGLFLYAGVIGFVGVWLPNLITIFLAARARRFARTPEERAAALGCIVAIVCCSIMAWGDTGAHFWQYKLATALSLALAGKLAMTTGAWPHGRSAPAIPAMAHA
jgi:hypothetical protein